MNLKQKRRIVILLPFVLVAGYGAWLNWSSSRVLDQALERAKAIGLPVTAEELNAAIPPDSENAAVEYEAAAELYRKAGRLDLMFIRSPSNYIGYGVNPIAMRKQYFGGRDVGWNDAVAVAKRMEHYFQLLLKGSKKPRYHSRFDWRVYPNVKNTNLKDGVFFCNSAAEAAARTGDAKRALEYLQTAIRISNHQKQEPSLISTLQGQACDTATQSTVRAIAQLLRGDPEVMRKVETLVDETQLPNYRVALRSEVTMNILGVEWLAKNREERDVLGRPYWEAQALKLPWVQNRVKAYLVESVAAGYAILPKSPNASADTKRALAKIDAVASSQSGLSGSLAKRDAFEFSSIGRLVDRAPVVILLTRACIRVLAEQPKGFPDRLPLSARTILDPFSGKPFLYKKLPGSFVLYSVGPDGRDDRGVRPMDISLVYEDGRIVARY